MFSFFIRSIPMKINRALSSNILDSFPFNMALLDASGVILQTNEAWKQFGEKNELPDTYQSVGTNYLNICQNSNDEYAQKAARGLKKVMENPSEQFTLEYPCHTRKQQRWFLLRLSSFRFEQSMYYLVIHIDITDRKLSEQRSSQLAEVVNNIPIGLITFTRADEEQPAFEILNMNPSAKQKFNLSTKKMQGYLISDLLPNANENGLTEQIETVLNSGKSVEVEEYRSSAPRLKERIWNLRIFPLPSDQGAISFEDITTQVKNRKRLEHIATHDKLTGLMNRVLFMNHLEEELNRSERYGATFCLMLLDLDHFKKVNDRYGHLTGDRVLERIGQCLRDNIRSVDIAGRYGGEEFVVLLPKTKLEQALEIAERVRELIHSMTFEHDNTSFQISCSIGLTSVGSGDESPQELIARADDALYTAKNEGRDKVVTART